MRCAMRPSWRATRAASARRCSTCARLIIPPSVRSTPGAALRAGAARGRARQRGRREHRPRRLRARRRRGRAQPITASAAAEAEFMIGALLADAAPRAGAAAPTACWSAASSAAPPSAWSAWRRRRARWRSCCRPSARASSATTRRCTPATRLGALEGRAAGPARADGAVPTRCACSSPTSAATTACSASASCRHCKPNQVLVSIAHSSLFDEVALADGAGRAAASPPPGSTASSPARSTRAGRCTTSTRCR